ncbi:unnamed protein product, partial [Heterosigma akashiwo]
LEPGERVIIICQDEVIYKAYDDQKRCWALPGFRALRKKGEGPGIMCSGFLTQQNGFLELSREDVDKINRCRQQENLGPLTHLTETTDPNNPNEKIFRSYYFFEYGKSREGYWNGDRMVEQLKEMIWVYEYVYPDHKLVFTFDYSQCHHCLPDDALTTSRMNVHPGGKNQPLNMRSAQATKDYAPGKNYPEGVKAGEFQSMYFQEGDAPPDGVDVNTDAGSDKWEAMLATPTLKGMKYILQERGLYVKGMTKNGGKERVAELSMKEAIGKWPEFQNQKSKLHEVVEARGHVCLFTPKYHCETVPIERVWCKSKYYLRQHCEYTWASLKTKIPVSLSPEVISPLTLARYYPKTRDYMRAYRAGENGPAALTAVKKYSSHRRP